MSRKVKIILMLILAYATTAAAQTGVDTLNVKDTLRLSYWTTVKRIDSVRIIPPKTIVLRGIPVGAWNLPADSAGKSSYNGAQMGGSPSMVTSLAIFKAKNSQVGISISRKRSLDANGLSGKAICAEINSWPDLEPWRAAGIIKYVTVADDIGLPFNGTGAPRYATIDSAANCVHKRWPKMPTVVRQKCSRLNIKYTWHWLDNCYNSYGGSKHGDGTPKTYVTTQEAAGKARGLGRIYGISGLDGGDGSSKIYGTFPNPTDPKVNRWQMSAKEHEAAAYAFLPYTCTFFSWTYGLNWKPVDPGRTPTQLKGIHDYELRSDIRAAWAKIRAVADTTPARPCYVRP